ncbi:serine/threonine-protein kinase [Actinocrispum wychmicini]|uniref:non-specific serine/threonine protein kinase n=1 Tax=Actinocrispum wychmicini TaxID=1213861 RepID=A0A4R2JI90_9PSEU|nr:serine/threonine-protein kinase [Actinocrispum wychmicini]TCO56716.1 serine/threonine protein kinase [Actinocrispum wychmicini]
MNRGDQLGAGRYTLLDELGRGGMGIVWLAQDSTIGRKVAIKELLLPPSTPPHERQVFEERVLREARTAGRLNDPGIVTVYDVLQESGTTFIVMELVEYPDLADVVAQRGPLPGPFVAKIAEQLLSALETAHAAGIVHRDVKPANVMVAPNGRVKLADFGIAQSIEDPKLTTNGSIIGSPTYISPERLLGHDASPASDLWALGATLFFAVEGFGAYDRPTTPAVIQAIMNERATIRIAQGPVATLVTGLMDPNPQTRLTAAQARQLAEQGREPTGEQTVKAMPVAATVGPPPAKNGGSRRWLAIGGVVVAVAAVVTAGILLLGGNKQQPGTTGPATNPSPAPSSAESQDDNSPASPPSSAEESKTTEESKPDTQSSDNGDDLPTNMSDLQKSLSEAFQT